MPLITQGLDLQSVVYIHRTESMGCYSCEYLGSYIVNQGTGQYFGQAGEHYSCEVKGVNRFDNKLIAILIVMRKGFGGN